MKDIAPGWYTDPADPSTQRYWDGQQWVGKAIASDATPPEGPPEPEPESESDTANLDAEDPSDPRKDPFATSPADFKRPTSPIVERAPGVTPPPDGIPVRSLGVTVGWITPSEVDRILHGRTLANPGRRLAARIIDIACLLGLNLVINGYFLYQYFATLAPYVSEYTSGVAFDDLNLPTSELQQQQWIMIGIALALWFAYEVPSTLNGGQTFGKRLMGIKVVSLAPASRDSAGVSEGSAPLGWGRLTLRWMYLGLPLICFPFGVVLWLLDSLWCVRDKPFKQCLHDKSPGTAVVFTSEVDAPPESSPPATDADSQPESDQRGK
ncbi:RDD family protein [Natronoglycomyces albus]|uniref:RDD family protein n=1 Tax=Natronoglycomyces albus TaxID=2811108 RepID=A0A895XVI8_9ACTN|nr:RDD family protein [Natronoglycomyces albus]QSB05658.1 RDD family protein [Natronoglycomyces albus]